MNNDLIEQIRQRTDSLMSLLAVSAAMSLETEDKRNALEANGIVANQKEERLNDRELALVQREQEQERQKKYIEERHEDVKKILDTIQLKKTELGDLQTLKEELQTQQTALDKEKQTLLPAQSARDNFEQEKATFAEEKSFFLKEKLAMKEAQQLLTIREQNIKTKEEAINRRDQLTQV